VADSESDRRGDLGPSRPWAIVAAILLLAGRAVPACAQGGDGGARALPPADRGGEIVVIGIPEYLRDIMPERRLGADDVAGYGLSSVDELVAELGVELGERDEPIFLVNGERVDDLNEIGGYPVEVIERLDVLPRGSGARVGASADRRVYSLTLRPRVRSATLMIAPRFATEGAWRGVRSEAILTRIREQQRINLSVRVRDEQALLESDREILQPSPPFPFDLRGNIIADPRLGSSEIDPALSTLAGRPVTLAAVPAGPAPTLAGFAAGVDAANLTDLGAYRTLRPRARNYELNLSIADRLASWLTASANARVGRSERHALLGLPAGLFLLSPTNPASPFSRAVALAVYGDPSALEQRSRTTSAGLNIALNATFGGWRLRFTANHQQVESRALTERQGTVQAIGFLHLPDDRNPFAGGLGDLLPVFADRIVSEAATSGVQLNLTGSPLALPAGPVRLTLETRLVRTQLDARSRTLGVETVRSFGRSERALRGALELPLTSRANDVLAVIGDLTATIEYSAIDFSRIGSASQSAFGLVWLPRDGIRLRASMSRIRRPAELPLLFDPIVTTPGIRTFDVLRGETVDVSWITGGNSGLLPQSDRTEQLSAIVQPWPAANLQLSAEYMAVRNRNFLAAPSPASLPILLAFPERFQRDANGVLTVVDARPVNFARYRERSLRYGLSFAVPLGPASSPAAVQSPAAAVPGDEEDAATGDARPRLAVTANHMIVLDSDILIRPGLARVDLLEGGAIGLAGGRPRHQLDFSASLSARGFGARLTGVWRSASLLETRLGDTTGRLRFSPLATFNLRLFADASRFVPRTSWLNSTRLSLAVTNLTNRRQRVADPLGNTPLQYQPAYLDSLGRTIEFELRKVF
jgi:iron complex outermembrane recepter protein